MIAVIGDPVIRVIAKRLIRRDLAGTVAASRRTLAMLHRNRRGVEILAALVALALVALALVAPSHAADRRIAGRGSASRLPHDLPGDAPNQGQRQRPGRTHLPRARASVLRGHAPRALLRHRGRGQGSGVPASVGVRNHKAGNIPGFRVAIVALEPHRAHP